MAVPEVLLLRMPISLLALLAVVFLGQFLADRRQVERTLAEREQFLRSIIDNEPECVKLLAADGTVLEMNRAGLEMIEAESGKQVVGHCVYLIVAPEYRQHFRILTESVFRGESRKLEFEIVGLKGSRRWLETHASPLRDAAGAVTALLSITRDVTKRRQAEEALVESERRFREVYENSRDAIFVEAFDGQLLDVNPAACRLHGFTREQLLSKNVRDLVPADQREVIDRDFAKLSRGELTQTVGVSLRADGTTVLVELSVSRIVYNGQPALLLHVRDITERKRSEAALHESERRYRQIVETASEGIWQIDGESRTSFVNQRMAEMLGYTLAEMQGASMFEFMDEEGKAIAADNVERRRRGIKEQHDFKFRCKDGSDRWAIVSADPIFDSAGCYAGALGLITDITERKRLEREIQEKQTLLTSILDASRDGIAVEEDDRIVFANRAMAELHGWTAPGELIGQHISALNSAQDNQRMVQYSRRRLRGEPAPDVYEFKGQRRDGSLVDMEASVATCELVGRACIVAIVRNITDRKRAQDALSASEERYRLLFERNLAGVFQSTLEGHILDCNEAFVRMFGYDSKDELLRCSAEDLYPPERRICYLENLLAERTLTGYELQLKRKDGSLIWGYENVALLPLGPHGEEIIQGTIMDFTELKRAGQEREQLNREVEASRQRFEDLSRRLLEVQENERRYLARELHDEIGQVLSAISVNLKIVSSKVDSSSLTRIDDCIDMVDRAVEQVRNLSLDLRPAVLDDFGLEEALRWYAQSQAKRAGLVMHLKFAPLMMDLSNNLRNACFRIAQEALTNVVRHAIARQVWIDLRQDDLQLRLLIRDDGKGFDAIAAQQRVSRSSSLGLLSMRERAELLGGKVNILSEPGRGTTVDVRFPVQSLDDAVV